MSTSPFSSTIHVRAEDDHGELGGFERRSDPSPEAISEVHMVGPRIGEEGSS